MPEPARLPAGACLTLTRRADGTWAGNLAVGVVVEAERPDPQTLTAALAQSWAGRQTAGEPGPTHPPTRTGG